MALRLCARRAFTALALRSISRSAAVSIESWDAL